MYRPALVPVALSSMATSKLGHIAGVRMRRSLAGRPLRSELIACAAIGVRRTYVWILWFVGLAALGSAS